MADQPIGITFMPSADAAANGPRQAGVEGQGGSDLAQAFKILSLHLPRVLGAAAIAPKRLLTSEGSAGVTGGGAGGFNPYSAVFQSLLAALTGGSGGADLSSLGSLFGNGMATPSGLSSPGREFLPADPTPIPRFNPTEGDPEAPSWDSFVPAVAPPPPTPAPTYERPDTREDTRYI